MVGQSISVSKFILKLSLIFFPKIMEFMAYEEVCSWYTETRRIWGFCDFLNFYWPWHQLMLENTWRIMLVIKLACCVTWLTLRNFTRYIKSASVIWCLLCETQILCSWGCQLIERIQTKVGTASLAFVEYILFGSKPDVARTQGFTGVSGKAAWQPRQLWSWLETQPKVIQNPQIDSWREQWVYSLEICLISQVFNWINCLFL